MEGFGDENDFSEVEELDGARTNRYFFLSGLFD